MSKIFALAIASATLALTGATAEAGGYRSYHRGHHHHGHHYGHRYSHSRVVVVRPSYSYGRYYHYDDCRPVRRYYHDRHHHHHRHGLRGILHRIFH